MTRLLLAVLAFCLLACAGLQADKVKMKDGRIYDGMIVEEDDQHVKIKVAQGSVSLKREDIAEITKEKSALQVREEKLLELRPSRPKEYLDLGKECLEQKQEGIGLHLVNLSMVLDPTLYVAAQQCLGDYWQGKGDRKKAAQCFRNALMADPANAECKDRYEKVKDAVGEDRHALDKALMDGLTALMGGNMDAGLTSLEIGRSSPLRARCEQLLGAQISDLIAWCQAKTPCKSCKGTGLLECTICKGKGWMTCPDCQGEGCKHTNSVQHGRVTTVCPTCQGWGDVACQSCKSQRLVQPVMGLGPDGKTYVQYLVPWVWSDKLSKPGYSWKGGTIPCRFCNKQPKGGGALPLAGPDFTKIGACVQFLQRQVSGKLSLSEMAESRMQRIGGAGPVEKAQELLERPVWWSGDFSSVQLRKKGDPTYTDVASPAGPSEDPDAMKKSAVAMQPESLTPEQFEGKVRKTFGVGGGAGSAQRGVCVTVFSTKAPDDKASAGPYAAAEGGKLVLSLVQVADAFSTRRIRLEGAGGGGLPSANLAGAASVRAYYGVLDSREDLAPSGDRDVGTLHLTAKFALIELLDADGKILQSLK